MIIVEFRSLVPSNSIFGYKMKAATVVSGDAKNKVFELDAVQPLLKKIVSRWSPKQIWLFGSRAGTSARSDSDWDLLVVASDDTPESEFDPLVAWQLQKNSGVYADIFLCRSSDFESCRDVPNTLVNCASSEGVLLYEY